MDGIVVSTTMSLAQGNLKHCKEINVLPNVRYVYELVTLVTNTITVRKTLFLDICIKAGQKPQKAAVFQVSPVFFKMFSAAVQEQSLDHGCRKPAWSRTAFVNFQS